MKTFLRPLALLALALFAASSPVRAAADGPGEGLTIVDTGRFLISAQGHPVGVEVFEYDRGADSVLVSATHTLTGPAAERAPAGWRKKFGMVVDANDFGLRSYVSNLESGGHVQVRGVIPGDTAMTVYIETDGIGSADRYAQPPGRLFVIDAPLFTLFDVLCRNLNAHQLARRPIELLVLGDSLDAVEGLATADGSETIRWGGRTIVAHRWVLEDATSRFHAWVDPDGRMLKLRHEESGLEVLREPPAAPAAKRAAPRPGAAKPAPKPPAKR